MDIVLSLVALSAIVLIAGAYFLWRRGGAQKQVWLMLVMAVVMIANLLIWAVPDSSGVAPMTHATQAAG